MALTCSGPDPPVVFLYRAKDASLLSLWEMNMDLRRKIADRDLPEILDVDVNLSEGLVAKARLWLPPGADTSGRTKYPMLVYV
jgi:hypothetical protein